MTTPEASFQLLQSLLGWLRSGLLVRARAQEHGIGATVGVDGVEVVAADDVGEDPHHRGLGGGRELDGGSSAREGAWYGHIAEHD